MSANEHAELERDAGEQAAIDRSAIDKMLADRRPEKAYDHDTVIHFMNRSMEEFRNRRAAGTKATWDESLLLIGKLRAYAEVAGSRRATQLEMSFCDEVWLNTGGLR